MLLLLSKKTNLSKEFLTKVICMNYFQVLLIWLKGKKTMKREKHAKDTLLASPHCRLLLLVRSMKIRPQFLYIGLSGCLEGFWQFQKLQLKLGTSGSSISSPISPSTQRIYCLMLMSILLTND